MTHESVMAEARRDGGEFGTGTLPERMARDDATPRLPVPRLAYLRDLVVELILRDLKLRYKRSTLGILWSLVTPLAQLSVLLFVFSVILPVRIPNYASFLFTGILVWSWLRSSLEQATGVIVQNAALVRQPGFPPAILPAVTVAANLIHLLLALPILGIFVWAGGGVALSPASLLLPVLLVIQFAFILSVAYFVASLHVTFRDVKHLLGVLLTLGFYLTPVFYSPEHVPARFMPLFGLNPMVHLVGAYRDVLLYGRTPPLVPLLAVVAGSVLLLLLGYRSFMRASHRFVDEL